MKFVLRFFNIAVFGLSLAILYSTVNKKPEKKSPTEGAVHLLISEVEVAAYNLKVDLGDLETVYKNNPSRLSYKVSKLGDKALKIRRKLDLATSALQDIVGSLGTTINLSAKHKAVKDNVKSILVDIAKLKSTSKQQLGVAPRLMAALGKNEKVSQTSVEDVVHQISLLRDKADALQKYVVDISKLLNIDAPKGDINGRVFSAVLQKNKRALSNLISGHTDANQQFAELKTKVISLEDDNKTLRQKITSLQRDVLAKEKELQRLKSIR